MQRTPQIAIAGVALLATLIAGGSRARADRSPLGERSAHLSRAIEAVNDRDYEKAAIHLRLALEAGNQSRDDTILIYRLSGEVAAAFGYRNKAKDFFAHMLSIDPRAEVSESEAPSVVGPYDAARAMFDDDNPPLTVDVSRDREAGIVTVEVSSDPFHLVHAARLIYRDDDHVTYRDIVANGGALLVDVPPAIRNTAVVTVVDQYGNQLMDPALALPPPPVAAPTAKPGDAAKGEPSVDDAIEQLMDDEPERSSGRSLAGRWYVWSGVTLVAAGAATYFGLRAQDDWARLDSVVADSGSHDFNEAKALESSGRRNQLITNIGVGVAVTSAVVSTVLLLRGDHHEQHHHTPVVSAAPVRGGAVFACEVGF